MIESDRQLAAAAADEEDGAELVAAGAHEPFVDALLYDYEYRRRRADVRFYRELAHELAQPDDPILELACGTGRISSALARDGYRVVGLDLSASMLRQAGARRQRLPAAARRRITLVRADMCRFALGTRFPLAVMAFNSFEHLYTRTEVASCLACIRQHLEPGGHLAFDVQNPNLRWLTRDPHRRWARTVFRHPVTGWRTEYSTSHEYDPVSQIVLIRLYYRDLEGPDAGRPPRVVHLSQRKFFPAELEALLHANRMRVVARYGDFHGEELHPDAESQVIVCQPQP